MWMGAEDDNNVQVESEQEGNISNLEDGSLRCVSTVKELMMVLEQSAPIVLGFCEGQVIQFDEQKGNMSWQLHLMKKKIKDAEADCDAVDLKMQEL
ncbi:hypothetical protein F0562_017895 [Nyssa sinensis]|uniref:Uncharacterized protein n=1 Tax=Nyssa sinensis TaxID=561372 RepID=A0A5J4ZAN1_9ASTE|nr:hypothetical protein F0562_017895 [Nyssa sinensis]